jgi:hypothetical protein
MASQQQNMLKNWNSKRMQPHLQKLEDVCRAPIKRDKKHKTLIQKHTNDKIIIIIIIIKIERTERGSP